MPNGIAMTVPATRPSRMLSRLAAGGAKRSISRMITNVTAPIPMYFGSPKSSDPVPPPNHPAATGISDRPMIRMTVPVTRGGNRCRSFANTGASAIMNTPDAMTEP